ncbi:hypothetical protein TNCV_206671 [Trichonephila clavipes]|nr:hypothetical protein TNCV_206671 [Trichonephila clavipes]
MCSFGERSGDLVLQGSVGQSREQFIATCAEFGWDPAFKGNVTSGHNTLLWDCVAYASQGSNATLPWMSPDKSAFVISWKWGTRR